jgi:hypothetical protein
MAPANPWLDIPLADYEAHTALPHVAQAELLARTLASAVGACSPASVAVLGCAGGNGFDRLPASLPRLVGIDVNPEYVAVARARHAPSLAGLELHVGDVERDELSQDLAALAAVRGCRLLRAELTTAGGSKCFAVQTFRFDP